MLRTIAVSLFFLFFSFKSLAGDYKVEYAIDMQGVAETEETEECFYDRSCMLKFKETDIHVFLIANVRSRRHFNVRVYGKEIWCCYFHDGDDTTQFEYTRFEQYKKLDIFVGRKRRGNEFIVGNQKIATLFLMFKDFH